MLLDGLKDERQRRFAQATLVNTVGTGLQLSAGTLFLVRSAGLSPSHAGLGLTVGGLVGVAAGVPVGRLADRHGSRTAVLVAMVCQAVGSLLLLLVHSVAALMVVASVQSMSRSGYDAARGALIAAIAPGGGGARLRTYLRALTNVGVAVGAIGAAVVLAIDERWAYAGMLGVDAATFLIAALIVASIGGLHARPQFEVEESRDGHIGNERRALRGRPYLLVSGLCAIGSLQYWVLITAVPLWLSERTEAPRWMAGAVFFLAAAIVAAVQVPATRSIRDRATASRLLVRSGPPFLIAWVLFALASGPSAPVAAAMLLVAVVVHCLGEVWQAGATFELSFALAAPDAQGEYQGVFGIADAVVEALGPLIVITACITWGTPGWVVLALVVWAAGIGAALVERRTRPDPPPTTPLGVGGLDAVQ